jgi:hypothetical protein
LDEVDRPPPGIGEAIGDADLPEAQDAQALWNHSDALLRHARPRQRVHPDAAIDCTDSGLSRSISSR